MLKRELLCNFIEITLRHECSPVNLLHILRTPFFKNTSEWLLLKNIWTFLIHFHTCFTITMSRAQKIFIQSNFESIQIVVKKQNVLFLLKTCKHTTFLVSGKFTPGQFPPRSGQGLGQGQVRGNLNGGNSPGGN